MANLITAQQVIDQSFTNRNTDLDLIKDEFIEIAQEEYVRPLLGNELYDEIIAEKAGSGLSALNTTLVNNYVIPMLAFYIKFEVIPDISINSTSKGLRVLVDSTSEPATDKQRADIQQKALNHAKTLRDKLIRYIEDNSTNYPLYKKSNITSKVSKYGGVVIPKR